MKKIITFLFILFVFVFLSFKNDSENKKEFEGLIEYQIGINSNDAKIKKEQESLYGTILKFYYKNGNYSIIYNGSKKVKRVVYSCERNKIFQFDKNNKLIETIDCSEKDEREVIISKTSESNEIICNRKCKNYLEQLEDGEIHSFYFDPEIFINPEHFKNFSLMYGPIKNMKSQYLGYTYTTLNNYTLTYRAINIVETELYDKIFEIN
ncbi:MAG: hypothetical protein V4667_08755 [Bacteroidota bacterium]